MPPQTSRGSDVLTRSYCSVLNTYSLKTIHNAIVERECNHPTWKLRTGGLERKATAICLPKRKAAAAEDTRGALTSPSWTAPPSTGRAAETQGLSRAEEKTGDEPEVTAIVGASRNRRRRGRPTRLGKSAPSQSSTGPAALHAQSRGTALCHFRPST